LFTIVGTCTTKPLINFVHTQVTITLQSQCLFPCHSLPFPYLLQCCLMLHKALNFNLMFWFFTYILVTWFSFVTLKVMEDNELRMWGIWGWGWGNRTCKWVLASIWEDYQRWHCYKRQSFLEGFIWDYKEKPEILVSIPLLSNNLVTFCTQYTLPYQEVDVKANQVMWCFLICHPTEQTLSFHSTTKSHKGIVHIHK
jgi:hypothetical protein